MAHVHDAEDYSKNGEQAHDAEDESEQDDSDEESDGESSPLEARLNGDNDAEGQPQTMRPARGTVEDNDVLARMSRISDGSRISDAAVESSARQP